MKTIKKVFLVIATLVLIFLIWDLTFNKNGVIQTGWNALIQPVNKVWSQLTGTANAELLPKWETTQGGSYEGTDDLGEAGMGP